MAMLYPLKNLKVEVIQISLITRTLKSSLSSAKETQSQFKLKLQGTFSWEILHLLEKSTSRNHHLSSNNHFPSQRTPSKTFWNSKLEPTSTRLILSPRRKLRKISIVRAASLWCRKCQDIALGLSRMWVKVLIMNLSIFNLHRWPQPPKGQLSEPKLPRLRVQALLIGEKIYLLQS